MGGSSICAGADAGQCLFWTTLQNSLAGQGPLALCSHQSLSVSALRWTFEY